MARQLRVQYPGAWYHVMNRGAGRQAIFRNNKHREKFLELIDEVSKTYDIELHAYCLMGNHYHLLLHTPLGNLSEGMRHLNSNYTKFYNKHTHRDGPLFRGRYKSIVINGDDYLLKLSRYIHLNPLQAGLVKNLPDYKWSSYPAYIGKTQADDHLMTECIKTKFDTVKCQNISYAEFVEDIDTEELRELFDKALLQPILGNQKFREFIAQQVAGEIDIYEQPDAKKLFSLPTIDAIINYVARYLQVAPSKIRNTGARGTNLPRQIAIFLSRELSKSKLHKIASAFNLTSYKSVSNNISRTRNSTEIMKIIDEIKKLISDSTAS